MSRKKKRLIINPEFGMAGDMFSAACISAGAPAQAILSAMSMAAEPLGGAAIKVVREMRSGTDGVFLDISLTNNEGSIDAGRALSHLEEAIDRAGITQPYADFAVHAMTILTEAERAAHQDEHGRVHHHHHTTHLHEAQDIIIDLAGAALGLELLAVDMDAVTCLSPVMVGGGMIRFSHGELPAPAPATARIIHRYQFPVEAGPVDRELFTPTGAAILAALQPRFARRIGFSFPQTEKSMTGTGFGSMKLSPHLKRANALSIVITA
jgi:uncharacterized protein (DUF111 family)